MQAISDNKKRLLQYEREQKYLFHGGGWELTELEPRQAYNCVDGVPEKDGVPAVFASPFLDYAVFMALINQANFQLSFSSSCSYENGQLLFGASQSTLGGLRDDLSGYVHVLSRDEFEPRGPSEWRSYRHVRPIEVLKIGRRDFDQPIHLIEFIDDRSLD